MTDDDLSRLAGECSERHDQSEAKYPHPGCEYCALLEAHYAPPWSERVSPHDPTQPEKK